MNTVLKCILCCLFLQNAMAGSMEHLRNQRYCEILIQNELLSLSVYNTLGLNQCPEHAWKRLTSDSIRKQRDVRFVYLNGPRHWVIDGLKNSKLRNTKVEDFDGLQAREAGRVKLSIWDLLSKSKRSYTQRTVDRSTTWVYSAHQPVYALIDAEGSVYVMQSYSLERQPQTLENLSSLGTALKKLPTGWRFCTGILPKTRDLVAVDGKAVVVQDEFLNTYQLQVDPDFLNGVKCK